LRDLMWATSFKAAQSDPMSFTRQRKNPGETRGAPTDAPQREYVSTRDMRLQHRRVHLEC